MEGMAIAMPNGYDYKYVDSPPDRLVCNICHLPSRDPYLTTCCGHVFCKSCLDYFKKSTVLSNVCPVCRAEEYVVYINKQLDREVKSLHVMCTNKERGCEWQGELNDINNHLGNSDGCQFEDVKCSNECGKMLQRQYLTSHIETECAYRKVDCQYCHITGEHQFIEREHKEQCPKLPLPCPNKCEVGSVPREDMEAHRKECPLEIVQCEYHNVGCEERMRRKRKREHEEEKMEEHLLLTKCRLTNNHHELSFTKAELTDIKSQLADTKSQLASTVEEVNTLKLVLHQALGHTGNISDVASDISVTKRWTELTAMSMLMKSGSQACPVVVKMTGYSEKKNNEVQWYSDPFYSHDKGYKICLCVNPAGNGDGNGTHLSMFLYLMKGPHDDELTWPLRGKFDVKLLNHISDCEHCSKTVIYDNQTPDVRAGRVTTGNRARGWGTSKLISNEDLHKVTPTTQYVKDDCIFLQVTKL
ncbi:TNF receptor-associated factor 4-like [Dysidea avara]|uniref:TNF receptor-associated factor 4-like n=1 Tax=Dysidea avara TaxID=196820 RepID=UPI00331FB3C4